MASASSKATVQSNLDTEPDLTQRVLRNKSERLVVLIGRQVLLLIDLAERMLVSDLLRPAAKGK